MLDVINPSRWLLKKCIGDDDADTAACELKRAYELKQEVDRCQEQMKLAPENGLLRRKVAGLKKSLRVIEEGACATQGTDSRPSPANCLREWVVRRSTSKEVSEGVQDSVGGTNSELLNYALMKFEDTYHEGEEPWWRG